MARLALGLLMAALTLPPGMAGAADPALYVSPHGDDRWSGSHADPTPDGKDGPVATLARAVTAARQEGRHAIQLRAGTYRLTETLALGAEDSGLRIAAYPGEQPVLSGGERVAGFTAEPSGVFSAPLAREPGLDVSSGGGAVNVRLNAARSGTYSPDDPVRSGWFIAQPVKGGGDKRRFRFTPGTVQPAWAAPGVRVQALDRERMADDIRGIASIDAKGTLTLDQDGWYPFREGTTFRLLGHPDFLKFPGQFAWRAKDKRLLVRPPADSAGDFARGGEVSVARLSPLIVVEQARGITIEGLNFADVPYDGTAIRLNGGTKHRVLGNRFVNVGTAVSVKGATDSEIRGNRMEHLGRSGIDLSPGSDGNRIIANTMRGLGEVNFFSAGVTGAGVAHTLIAHNDIAHAARYGISLKNWSPETKNTDNTIEYNRIRDVGRETADLGAIEMLGRSDIDTRTTIRFNDIRGTGGLATDQAGNWLERYKGFGVYLDDLTNGVTVESNFLEDTGWASVFIHGGDHNRVQNNIAVLTDGRDKFLRLEWVPKAGNAGFLHDNAATRNLLFLRAPVDQVLASLTGGDYVFDNNVLDRPGRGKTRAAAPERGAASSAPTVQGAPDAHFMDPDKDDFRLRPDSPARQLGIDDLPWARIGPQGAQ